MFIKPRKPMQKISGFEQHFFLVTKFFDSKIICTYLVSDKQPVDSIENMADTKKFNGGEK